MTARGGIAASMLVVLVLAPGGFVSAEGHGPLFGLATPTLGEGQWSSDTVLMQLRTDEGRRSMFQEMVGYGITEDLQATLALPVARSGDTFDDPPRMRGGAMMGRFPDVEAGLLWRFQRHAPGVGRRRESTLLFNVSAPTEHRRGGVEVGPSVHVGAVTGYASRTVYWWVGAGYQRYFEANDDRLGDLAYGTAVVGYRPPVFRGDYPKPDWRVFVEAVVEHAEANRIGGERDADSGGEKLLLGPSTLGLFGAWGISAGVLYPIEQDLDGDQPEEGYRAKAVFTYWF